jgi:sporulation protein YlmC with PRC-barrel domain
MIRIFLPLFCAALGFMAASCSQSEGPFAPAEAPAPPPAVPHGAAGSAMASQPIPQQGDSTAQSDSAEDATPTADPQASSSPALANTSADAPTRTPAERRASTLIGMPVVSGDGTPLGNVKDIIFDRQGRATHLVIAYDSASTPDGKLTAMPWDAAAASIKNGRLVLEEAQLTGAPSFTPDAWPDLDDPSWSATADAYWRKAVQAAIAAHPGTPIDSPDRQRERPARDGDGNPY